MAPAIERIRALDSGKSREIIRELAAMWAEIPDDDAHWQYQFTTILTVAYLRHNEVAESDRVLTEFHRRREKYNWDDPMYRWSLEVRTADWHSLRFIPDIEKILLSRVRNWQGLGVLPGESHTPQSLIDLEYVLFHLGGNEARQLLFADLRPRILASFPSGHPMRALCEARWSFTLRKLGRVREAREIVGVALKELILGRPNPNRRLELALASEAGLLHMAFGEFAVAREVTANVPDDIEAIYPETHHSRGYAWGHRAMILTGLGDYEGAIAAWKKSAQTDVKNARMRLGILLVQIGRVDEGKKLIEEEVDPDHVWTAWGWLGAAAMVEHYLATGDTASAAKWHAGALAAVEFLSPESVPETAYLLLLDSRIAALRGDAINRRKKLAEALAMASSGRNEINRVRIMFEWADLLAGEGNPVAAIAMGKNAAKRLQAFRLEAARGGRTDSSPLLHSFQPSLELLNERLIDAGRLPEVEQVLAVLNEERFFDFVRSVKRYAADGNIALNDLEERLAAALGTLEIASAAAHEKIEHDWLNPTLRNVRDGDASSRRPQTDFSRAERSRLQQQAAQLIEPHTVSADNTTRDGSLAVMAALQPSASGGSTNISKSSSISVGSAMVTFLVSQRGISILIETLHGIEVVPLQVASSQLNRAIQRFRQVLARPDIDAKPAARALYDLMFQNADAVLKRQGIKRVYLAVDAALRYLPFAALHDGRSYLVDRYIFASVSATATVKDSSMLPAEQANTHHNAPTFAIFAVSQFDSPALIKAKLDAAPLPNALRELTLSANALAARIVAQTSPAAEAKAESVHGKKFAEFSRAQFTQTMEAPTRPEVVHIASHFQFSPAAEAESKLLTSDGYVSLREMSAWNWQGVDLVTFSACNTGLAAADSEAKAYSGGPHEVVMRAGARNVIASLWMVNDASTATFMPKMYSDATPDADWGARINNTQRWFAHGGAGAAYSHPHHWAAFVLHTKRQHKQIAPG